MKKITGHLKSIAAFAAFAVIAYFGALWYIDNRMPAFEAPGVIRIRPEMTVDELFSQVDSLLKPRRPASVRRAFAMELANHSLCPGSYFILTSFTARYFAREVTRGWENPVNLVLSGRIRSIESLSGKISRQMMVDSITMLNALRDPALLAKFGITPDRLFYYILPDTYEVYWTASAETIIERLKAERDLFWNQDRIAAAKEQGLTPDEATVLASIVCEESSRPDEYPRIASVYLNRIRKGMKLQACPTVCYLTGYSVKRVLKSHLEIDSPFNTYIYAGLPPSPISIPGKEHIEAVLHPDPQPYLYFCADHRFNGRNVFSRTYSEHIQKANLYRKALDDIAASKQVQKDLSE